VKEYVSRKWRNWYHNEVDEERKEGDSRDKVKYNERSEEDDVFGGVFVWWRINIVCMRVPAVCGC